MEHGTRDRGHVDSAFRLALLLVKTYYAPVCLELGAQVLPDIPFYLAHDVYGYQELGAQHDVYGWQALTEQLYGESQEAGDHLPLVLPHAAYSSALAPTQGLVLGFGYVSDYLQDLGARATYSATNPNERLLAPFSDSSCRQTSNLLRLHVSTLLSLTDSEVLSSLILLGRLQVSSDSELTPVRSVFIEDSPASTACIPATETGHHSAEVLSLWIRHLVSGTDSSELLPV